MGKAIATSHFLFHLFDLVLPLAVAGTLYKDTGNLLWSILITIITLSPLLLINVVSIIWTCRNMDFNGKRCGQTFCFVLHCCQGGMLWRYFKLSVVNDVQDIDEFCRLRLLQASLQCGPLVIIIGYLQFINNQLNILPVVCLMSLLMSMAFSYTFHHVAPSTVAANSPILLQADTAPKRHKSALVMEYCQHLFMMISRFLSIVMFSVSPIGGVWVLLMLAAHFLIYGLVSVIKDFCTKVPMPKKCSKGIVRLFNNYAQCYDLLDLYVDNKICKIVTLCLLYLIENGVMSSVWFLHTDRSPVQAVMLAIIYLSYIIGIVLLAVRDCTTKKHHKTCTYLCCTICTVDKKDSNGVKNILNSFKSGSVNSLKSSSLKDEYSYENKAYRATQNQLPDKNGVVKVVNEVKKNPITETTNSNLSTKKENIPLRKPPVIGNKREKYPPGVIKQNQNKANTIKKKSNSFQQVNIYSNKNYKGTSKIQPKSNSYQHLNKFQTHSLGKKRPTSFSGTGRESLRNTGVTVQEVYKNTTHARSDDHLQYMKAMKNKRHTWHSSPLVRKQEFDVGSFLVSNIVTNKNQKSSPEDEYACIADSNHLTNEKLSNLDNWLENESIPSEFDGNTEDQNGNLPWRSPDSGIADSPNHDGSALEGFQTHIYTHESVTPRQYKDLLSDSTVTETRQCFSYDISQNTNMIPAADVSHPSHHRDRTLDNNYSPDVSHGENEKSKNILPKSNNHLRPTSLQFKSQGHGNVLDSAIDSGCTSSGASFSETFQPPIGTSATYLTKQNKHDRHYDSCSDTFCDICDDQSIITSSTATDTSDFWDSMSETDFTKTWPLPRKFKPTLENVKKLPNTVVPMHENVSRWLDHMGETNGNLVTYTHEGQFKCMSGSASSKYNLTPDNRKLAGMNSSPNSVLPGHKRSSSFCNGLSDVSNDNYWAAIERFKMREQHDKKTIKNRKNNRKDILLKLCSLQKSSQSMKNKPTLFPYTIEQDKIPVVHGFETTV